MPDNPAIKGIKGDVMNLSAPTMPVFLIAVALFILALIGHFIVIPYVTAYQFWIAIIAFVVLALGNLLKGV
jgi:hypothetical protein